MGLAVAFIRGPYLGTVVQALVEDMLMPILQASMPGVAWEAITIGPFRVSHSTGSVVAFIIALFAVSILVTVTGK